MECLGARMEMPSVLGKKIIMTVLKGTRGKDFRKKRHFYSKCMYRKKQYDMFVRGILPVL